MLGLPGTGKSTYLGALWALIEDPAFQAVTEVDFRGDRTYVQGLAEAVIGAEPIQRTPTASAEGLEADVEFAGHGCVTLSLADRSGEQLRELVEERHWLPLLRHEAETLDAILLFVHPGNVHLPIPLRITQPLLGGDDSDMTASPAPDPATIEPDLSVEAGSAGPEDGSATTPFTNKRASTAAQIVDALENLVELRRDRWPLPVVVVVSAFDLSPNRTPLEWLNSRLAAVASFLETNTDRVTWTAFGVSAQGGPLPAARAELLAKGDLLERCFAQAADGASVPLSQPVTWALGWR